MPLTNRRRIMFLSPEHEERLGEQAYREILSSSRCYHHHTRDASWSQNRAGDGRAVHEVDVSRKVFVHSGLFKVLRNEDALAAVMFHEAAHGLARHGAEKISFSLLVYGLLALIFPDYGQISDLMVKLAVDLPFSRKLELEADSIGLRLMAQACYDPRASIQMNASLVS
ncbi:Peptidase M48 [Phytophthora cactorum]|nr:Peptidase M48 [Phytophthora cactorum]